MPPSFLPSHASRESLHRLHAIVFNLGRRQMPSLIPRLRRVPEPAESSSGFSVSSSSSPPSSRARLAALATVPTARYLTTAQVLAFVDSVYPATYCYLRWMRGRAGYLLVAFTRPAAACSSSLASHRSCFGRRR